MTIDEAISHLNTYSSTNGSGQTTQAQHEESKRVAMDTMRMFQKIEEIMSNSKDTDGDIKYNWLYEQIREVVEDGTN